jgi:excisionase family DNA binding protein
MQREADGAIRQTPATPLLVAADLSDKAEETRLLSVRDVAKMMDISTRTVYELVSKNQLPSIRIGSIIRFDVRDIQRWMDHHRGR